MNTFNTIKFIKQLSSIGERQGKNESLAADLIIKTLKENDIDFTSQNFNIKIPLVRKASLLIDDEEIACRATCFVSGEIRNKDNIISSLFCSDKPFEDYNINFNPNSNAISKSCHYFAPSLAIKKSELSKLLKAEKILGTVEIEKYNHKSKNILVGNINKPKNILFAHYDSIEMGATDNASGVSVLMNLLISHPKLSENNLFVFSGCEELSYNKPYYWGYGFRVFEKKYIKQLNTSKNIIIVDCVGNGKTNISKDNKTKRLAFPISNLNKLSKKILVIHGDIEKIMKVYHSSADNISQLNQRDLNETVNMLLEIIKKS